MGMRRRPRGCAPTPRGDGTRRRLARMIGMDAEDGLRARGSKRRRPVSFDRGELSTLLSLYSEQVAAGHWRDYAIDSLPGQALFSVYRSAYENPDFVVAKQIAANGKGREFVVYQGPKRVMRSETLAEVLRHFEPLRERARLRLRSF